MAITNPFAITYGSMTVGGGTRYQLHGPYVIEKSYDALRLVFDVVVSTTSFADLKEQSDALESAFRARLTTGDELTIDLDGAEWTYTAGSTILHAASTITKSGNRDTDKGFARAYTVAINAELPADNSIDAGLRSIEVLVEHQPSRQRTVTMRGTYTATNAGDALSVYQSSGDTEALAYLDALGAGATWELATESYSLDRERSGTTPRPHLCNFTRQYVELLVDQTRGTRDDPQIQDHRVTFTDLSQHPGDSREGLMRLRRVVGAYDCAVNIDETTDLQTVYSEKIAYHVKQLFRDNFEPTVFAVEEARIGYDETSKRLSASVQFVYQSRNAQALVEVSQSVAYRETRQIDYTPVHTSDEFAYEADVGWATAERVWTRTAIVVGDETPKKRILEAPDFGAAGPFSDVSGIRGPDVGNRSKVEREGWNIVASTSQTTPQWIGDPTYGQIQVTTLTETVVERYHRRPAARTTTPRGTTTPRR